MFFSLVFFTVWSFLRVLKKALDQNSCKASLWSCCSTDVLFGSSTIELNEEQFLKCLRTTVQQKRVGEGHYWKHCRQFKQDTTMIQRCKEKVKIEDFEDFLPQKWLNPTLLTGHKPVCMKIYIKPVRSQLL